MKKWMLSLLLLLTAPGLFAQRFPQHLLMCMNPSGNLIPINSGIVPGQIQAGNFPQVIGLGTASDGNQYPLQCDTSGNLIVSGGSGSGTVSGQTVNCLPKASATTALTGPSAVCDNGSVVSSSRGFTAPSLSTPALTVTACSTGQAPLGDGTGACFTPGSGGGSPGGSNLQLQFNNSGAFGGATGISTDSTTKSSLYATATIPALTPHADIRNIAYAGGAACDGTGVTDDTASMQPAITAAMGTGGSGVVFIPDGCYFANASGFTNVSTNQLTIELAGKLILGSTFLLPPRTGIKCLGKGVTPQFATGTVVCNFTAPPGHGTMGTAITATNTPVTFTPTFAGGTSLPVGSAITIAGIMTCATTNVTRTLLAGSFPTAGPANTIANIGACTDSSGNAKSFRIPPLSKITITGCSDTSFNTPTGGYFNNSSDFPALTMGWRSVGSAASVSDGSCVISGFNLDSLETERITASSGGTVTATFNYVHDASDLWGEVGMAGTYSDLRYKLLEGVQVTGNWGAGFWADENAMMKFDGVSFSGVQYLTSIPMVFTNSWGWTFERSMTSSWSGYVCPTAGFNCGDIGPPFDMMQDTMPPSLNGTSGAGAGIIGPNSTLSIGMYITNAIASSSMFATGPVFDTSVIEQPMWNGVTFDNRRFSAIYQTTFRDSLIQDNVVASTAGYVGMSDSGAVGKGQVAFYNESDLSYGFTQVAGIPKHTVGKYWCGQVSVSGASNYDSFVWPECAQATVTYNDGRSITGELTTPPFGPVYIPWPTKLTSTTPASWACTSCTVTTGISDPIGGTSAGTITSTAGAFGSVVALNYSNASTATGDVLLYGVSYTNSDGLSRGAINVTTFGTDTFDTLSATGFVPNLMNQPWHSIVGMSIVKTGQAGSHAITFTLLPSQNVAGGIGSFWMPWVMHIPASAGIPISTIQAWRAQALHGFVPSNTASGNIMAYDPSMKVYFGNDTDIYSAPVAASLTQIGIASNVLTVTVPNTFSVGSRVTFSGMGTNTDLNGVQLQIKTQTSTNFTATYQHANVTLAADTGTVTGHAGVVKTDGSYDAAQGFLCGGVAGTSGLGIASGGAGNPCTYTAFAPLSSPTFTGTPAAPTAAPGTNTTQLATTGFVAASFAPLASPTLTGTPAAPTATGGTNTTQIATTQFVQSAISGASGVVLTEWMSGGVKTAGVTMLANATQLWNFVLPGSLTSTKITYTPSTADNSANLYDMGIYSATGTLLCHLGATAGTTFAPNTNPVTLSWASSCALSGGVRYLFAETAVTATAFISTGGVTLLGQNRQAPSAGGTTTGGVLNGSVTVGTDAPSVSNGFPQIWLHN